VPELVQGPRSVLWYVLDTIELRMQRAAEVMLPALRHALHGFTKRADIIIRQLSYLHSQHDSSVVEVCQQLAQLPAEQQNQRLAAAAANMAAFGLGLVDPAQIKLQQRRRAPQVQTAVAEAGELDQGAHCELLVQQLLDQAFIVNDQLLYDSISRKLVAGEPLSSAELSIETASDLLAAAHVVELGAINQRSSQHRFLVQPTGRQLSNDYYQSFDEFTITLVTDNHDQ
jgi:hypothetical protein